MHRALWQITVAGWISAALTVSPVLAAMQCRTCCDSSRSATEEAAAPCCAEHAQPKATEAREPCPTCPKCDARRPHPAVTAPSSDWKPPVLAVTGDWPQPFPVRTELIAALDSGRSFVDRAMPPPRVLFCTWQK